jgi:hypothetical protein
MREKYIVREIGNEKEGFIFGIVYTPPTLDGKQIGMVKVGGPDRFRDKMLLALQIIEKECKPLEEGHRLVTREGNPNRWDDETKSRWFMQDVTMREWRAGLIRLHEEGMSLEETARFRRLMW